MPTPYNQDENTVSSFNPACAICRYMIKPGKGTQFRIDVLRSSYYDINGEESMAQVNLRYGSPFTMIHLYKHCLRHQPSALKEARKRKSTKSWRKNIKHLPTGELIENKDIEPPAIPLATTIAVIETPQVANTPHERALDEFIRKGRIALDYNELKVTPVTLLQAIKIKSEIERSTKDRRLEMLKNMFTGAAPVQLKPKEDNGV